MQKNEIVQRCVRNAILLKQNHTSNRCEQFDLFLLVFLEA